jgi:biotin carboxyl carrier protein
MRLKITVEGKSYEVDVAVAEPEVPTNVRYVGGSGGGHAASGPVVVSAPKAPAGGREPANEALACRSPLAGVVSEVCVKPGDEVKPEQAVLILEAMKMFTTITSPVQAKVKSIEVAVADPVKQGQLLVEFE